MACDDNNSWKVVTACEDANDDTLTVYCQMVYFNVLETFIPPMMLREIQPIITNLIYGEPYVRENQLHYEDLGEKIYFVLTKLEKIQ